ncbi:four helix bundle protein [Candidatus Aerophobetes bacterium]|nr:four helix bundle protein [Candidatus Aerophobetes bacterium]
MNQHIYKLSSGGNNFRSDFTLIAQIRRASISIMANTTEGFDRGLTRNQ